MSDLIRREDALDALGEKPLAWTEGEYELGLQNQWQSDVDALKALPSAEPERKWISVTEALPINDDWVIVSIYDDDGDTSWQYTTPGFYVPYGKCWIVDNEYCKNVIAWMPLPEPWRGER